MRIICFIIGLTDNIEPSDAQFGGYFVNCTENHTVTYTFENDLSAVLSLGVWFRPRDRVSQRQTLFDIRSDTDTQWNLAVEYQLSADTLTLKQNSVFSFLISQAGIALGKYFKYY